MSEAGGGFLIATGCALLVAAVVGIGQWCRERERWAADIRRRRANLEKRRRRFK